MKKKNEKVPMCESVFCDNKATHIWKTDHREWNVCEKCAESAKKIFPHHSIRQVRETKKEYLNDE